MTSENNQNSKEQANQIIKQYQEKLQDLINQDIFINLTNIELRSQIIEIRNSYSCSQLKPHDTDKKENILTILDEINRTSTILYKQLKEIDILELREEILELKEYRLDLLKLQKGFFEEFLYTDEEFTEELKII